MKIKCWGARGSIPVSGAEYQVYGGDTACIEIRTKQDEIIIVDAGSGIRRLGNKLAKEKKNNFSILFTHAHWDHILGFPFFKPCYQSGKNINIFGCPFAQKTIKDFLDGLMTPPHFPIRVEDMKAIFNYHAICTDQSFSIYSIQIVPILLSHPNQGIGYKFIEDGKSFVFLTDNELTFKHPGGLEFSDYLNFCQGVDLLIHDSEYHQKEYQAYSKGWGHSTYNDALDLALQANVKRFGLFHHNQERSDKEVDDIINDCHCIIQEKNSNLECIGIAQGWELDLS